MVGMRDQAERACAVLAYGDLKRVELAIALLRQHDADGGQQIAAARLGGKAFALEAEGASARGPRRHRDLDRLVERRHPHLGAQHRLVERDWQVDAQIAAIHLE